MINVEKKVEFAASSEEIWGVVSDLSRWSEWLTMHQKWKGEVPAGLAPGSTFTGVASVLNMPNTITWTVDEYDAPAKLAISGNGMAGASIAITLSVESAGSGSRLSVSSGFEGQMVVGAIAGALERAANTELETSLNNLASLVA